MRLFWLARNPVRHIPPGEEKRAGTAWHGTCYLAGMNGKYKIEILREDAFGAEAHCAISYQSKDGQYHFGWIPTELLKALAVGERVEWPKTGQ